MEKMCTIVGRGTVFVSMNESPRVHETIDQHIKEVDDIFQADIDFGLPLYNDLLFVVDSFSVKEGEIFITGAYIEYKYYYAQRKGFEIGINSLGVSGLILLKHKSKEHLVFAKRSEDVTSYPGYYELIPSGGIDADGLQPDGNIDYQKVLRKEFVEETGVDVSYIQNIYAIGLIHDSFESVYDICCVVETSVDYSVMLNSIQSSREYYAPELIPLDSAKDFIDTHKESIVPTSKAFIELYTSEG